MYRVRQITPNAAVRTSLPREPRSDNPAGMPAELAQGFRPAPWGCRGLVILGRHYNGTHLAAEDADRACALPRASGPLRGGAAAW
jgi:hypothetical protein